MSDDPARRAPAFFYGWVIVAVVFITIFYVLGIRFAFGVFYVAILDEMSWSRAETAGVLSVAMLTYMGTAVLSGYLLDRLGPRLLFPLGAALLGIGLMLSSRIATIGELYFAYGVFVGIGFAFLGFIPHMALVTRWFVRRRGLATSIAFSGIGAGALAMVKLTDVLVRNVGWREAFFWYGVGSFLIIIPLTSLLHRDQPSALGLQPDGIPGTQAPSAHASGTGSLLGAARHPAFWTLLGAVFMIGWNSNTMGVHQARLMIDFGLVPAVAATLFGLSGLFRSGGVLFWGTLSDQIGRRACAAACTGMGAIALVLLIWRGGTGSVAWMAVFVVLWGFGFDGISPLYGSTVADRFHGRNLGLIFGALDLGFGAGGAAGPWFTGYLFDQTGSYAVALWMLMGTCLLGGGLLWASAEPRARTAARHA